MRQEITVKQKQIITKANISRILANAKGTYDYASFKMENGKYITVIFTKNNKFEIATNSRDYNIIHDIKILKLAYSQAALADFVFKWIMKLKKQ